MTMTFRWLLSTALIPLVFSWSFSTDETSQPGSEEVTISSIKDACREHSYKTHIISEDPLVIYIESFVTPEEASQLTDLR
jgi:prolyl 4-hydroxylase